MDHPSPTVQAIVYFLTKNSSGSSFGTSDLYLDADPEAVLDSNWHFDL